MKFSKPNYGEPLDFPPFKGRINPEFRSPEFVEKIGRFPEIFQENSHHILFSGRNRISVIPFIPTEGGGINIAVKEFSTQGIDRIKTLFLSSKARKAWQGGVFLMEQNIPTPVPVAYLEKYRSPFIDESCYFSVLEESVEEIRHLFRRLPSAELESLVRSLARHLSLCHKKGILHRDLSDGNVLVKREDPERPTFFLIDTNRIRVKRRMGLLRRIKNLTRLGVPDDFQIQFLEEYTGEKGLKKGRWFWYRLTKKSYTVLIDVKKRLRLGKKGKAGKAE